MAKHNDIGYLGEKEAEAFLFKKGYEILERNWRIGKAEIDIIARAEEVLIFIEVKTRTNTNFGQPEDFVDAKKIKFLTSAAGDYMREINHEWEVRFDIVSIVILDKNRTIIKHIEDAFFMGLEE
ncbi:MAG: putative endonuclease [Saprospiraceae bacterium]|jgi:putative endonuclease